MSATPQPVSGDAIDSDAQETREWIDALSAVIGQEGPQRHADGVVVELGVFAQRQLDVFAHRHRVEQRAALKGHAHVLAQIAQLVGAHLRDVLAQQFDAARGRLVQAEQVAQREAVTTLEDHLEDGGFGSWLAESLGHAPALRARLSAKSLSPEVCGLVGSQATLNARGGLR